MMVGCRAAWRRGARFQRIIRKKVKAKIKDLAQNAAWDLVQESRQTLRFWDLECSLLSQMA